MRRCFAGIAILLTALGVLALAATAARAQLPPCVGDCGDNGAVSVDELVRGVGILLGLRAITDCVQFDRDGNGQVAVNELILGVTSALNGCQAAATPSAAVPSPTPTMSIPPTGTRTATPGESPRPNVLLINLDDTRYDGIDRMPVLQSRLAAEGVSFSESFVPNAVCCPSRASLLTGLYAIHHGTRAVSGPLGGADTFRESGADRQTIAVWLRNAGYTTGLFGKYLNDYSASEADKGPGGRFYIPPGWDRWRAFVSPEAYGGVNGRTYQIVDETRTVTVYDDHATDAQYSTDVLGQWVREFVADAVEARQSFFIYWAPYASHGDPITPAPAQRHLLDFAALEPFRPPNWNEPDISDKPRWVHDLKPDPSESFTDNVRNRAYESLLSVDEQLAMILDQLETLGVAGDTIVLLTSDNGAGWGEHRMFAQAKEAPYEEDIRVPLIARYLRRAQGPLSFDAPVLNIDVAPTLAELAGITVPVAIDGESFAGFLTAAAEPPGRQDFLLEHFRQVRSDTLGYTGAPSDGDQVRLFHGPPFAKPRASVLFEFDTDQRTAPGTVQVPIGPNPDVSFLNLGLTVDANVPSIQFQHNADTDVLSILDFSPEHDGVYWVEEIDSGNVLLPNNARPGVASGPPDYVGVRDVAGGYTYVEYETEEIELYDLNVDPWQLENKATDPAYASVRARLSARLGELLAADP